VAHLRGDDGCELWLQREVQQEVHLREQPGLEPEDIGGVLPRRAGLQAYAHQGLVVAGAVGPELGDARVVHRRDDIGVDDSEGASMTPAHDQTASAEASLAERLGYRSDDRIVIVNCDDLGSSHAANHAIRRSVGEGAATSATLMVPCPWAADAAADPPGADIGVHLTLTAEWDTYRWGPVTAGPSLLDAEGRLPRTIEEVWDRADLDEVRAELRAQIDQAERWGLDVTHLDSHMGTLQLHPLYFDIYLDLAVEYSLPLRLSGWSTERAIGFEFRARAADAGVVAPITSSGPTSWPG
jgi:hypothetical protein